MEPLKGRTLWYRESDLKATEAYCRRCGIYFTKHPSTPSYCGDCRNLPGYKTNSPQRQQ